MFAAWPRVLRRLAGGWLWGDSWLPSPGISAPGPAPDHISGFVKCAIMPSNALYSNCLANNLMATLPAMRPGAPQVQPSTLMRDEKHSIRLQYLQRLCIVCVVCLLKMLSSNYLYLDISTSDLVWHMLLVVDANVQVSGARSSAGPRSWPGWWLDWGL